MDHTALSVDTLLRQFLFVVVHSASNLQTLRCFISSRNDWEIDCGAVAPSFPQLAHLHALDLVEEFYSTRRWVSCSLFRVVITPRQVEYP